MALRSDHKSPAPSAVAGWLGWLGLMVGLAGPLRAELQWKERQVRIDPPVGVFDLQAEFECVNRGTTPVRVLEVRSGCGCTVGGMDKDLIKPGETARLQARFEAGERRGHQSVAITVLAAEPAVVRHELTLEIALKDVVVTSARALVWRLGEEPVTKPLQVTPAAGFDLVEAVSASPDFRVEIVARTTAGVQLRITPRDTWAKRTGSIRLKAAATSGRAVDTFFPVQVQ